MQTLVMTLPAETSTNREYSLKCSVTQDAFSGFTSDAITIVPTVGGDEKVRMHKYSQNVLYGRLVNCFLMSSLS